MRNRIELAKYFGELGFKVGAEIGVFEGHYAEILFKHIPNLKLFCIDPWRTYRGAGDREDYRRPIGEAYQKAVEALSQYNAEIIRKTSLEALSDFGNESLDFVYIDGNHQYDYVKEDIEGWCKKVRKGGVVAGHDYYTSRTGNRGVIQAVDEFVAEYGYQLQLTDWDKETIIDHDDRQPSWYFIKL